MFSAKCKLLMEETVVRKITILITLLLAVNIAFATSNKKAINDAKAFIEKGDLVAAEGIIDDALTASPDDHKLLRIKGKILYENNDYSGALEYYEKALKQKSKDHESLLGAGMASLQLGKAEEALEYFKRGEKTKKQKGEFLYGQALAYKELGDLSEADVVIRKAIKKDKDNPKYQRAFGDINFEKEVWVFAINAYKKVIELDSSQTDLYYKLARANFYSMNFNVAVDYYKEYLKIFSSDTTAWRELGLIYEKSNNISEAVFCYKKLTELIPDDGDNWYTLGDLQFKLHQYEDAGVSLEKAVELSSHVAESYKDLAKIYQLRKEYFKADSAYTRYEQELGAPDNPQYWADKGKIMIKIGLKDAAFFDRAVVAYDKAIELDSAQAHYWEYGGLARYYKQEYANAIPFFKKRIELGGESVNALRNMAFCYLKTEKYELAAATLEKAIALKPGDPVMSQMVGKIYVFLQKEAEAIEHYKVALRDTTGALSASDICKIHGDLGYCYVQLRDPSNAEPYLLKAIKCDSKNVDYLLNLASVYHLDNQIEKANEYYENVLDIDPKHKAAKEGYLRTKTKTQ